MLIDDGQILSYDEEVTEYFNDYKGKNCFGARSIAAKRSIHTLNLPDTHERNFQFHGLFEFHTFMGIS